MDLTPATQEFLLCHSRYDLARVFRIPVKVLTHLAYSNERKYSEFTIPKKDGSSRDIYSPSPGLKAVQKKIKIFLEEIYNPPICVFGFIPGRDAIKNGEQHLRKRAVLGVDIKDFFPSIHPGRIYGLFKARPFNFNSEVASTLTRLVCYKNSLPQGSPCSPVLSNIISFKMDRDFIKCVRDDRLTYTRYADDITISSRTNFPTDYFQKDGTKYVAGEKIKKIVKDNGFEINPKKTRFFPVKKPHFVTGVKVNTKPNVSWNYIRQIRAMLHAWEKFGYEKAESRYNELHNHNGFPKNLKNVLRGKIEHVRHIKTELDLTYRKLYNKFSELEGVGRGLLSIGEAEELYTKIQVVSSGEKQGSGFIYGMKYLITCAHTLEDRVAQDEIEYFGYNQFSGATRNRGRILVINRDYDLALISITREHSEDPSLSFLGAQTDLQFQHGTLLKAVGFPQYRPGNPPHIIPEAVISWANNRFGVKEIYVDRPLFSGMSGGVMLNNTNQVVGVISRGVEDAQRSGDSYGNIFVPFQYVENIIRSYEGSLT